MFEPSELDNPVKFEHVESKEEFVTPPSREYQQKSKGAELLVTV